MKVISFPLNEWSNYAYDVEVSFIHLSTFLSFKTAQYSSDCSYNKTNEMH